ncbi:tetratricopeptide repeat protein [Burkholderia pyrrocinia]|nr:tetratricopeptide repeat protein [Burkholderia pyrrocinia]
MPRRGAAQARRVTTTSRQLEALAAKFRAAIAAQHFEQAGSLAEVALKLAPGHPSVMADYALCLMRTKRYDAAYAIYQRIHAMPATQQRQAGDTWLDGFAEVCGWLGLRDELRELGHQSLAAADERFRGHLRWPIDRPPPAFDARAAERNVIAYSLYGANPRYCEPAVMNARIVDELFPGWTCRVYLDDTVPLHVIERLRQAGAQVVQVDERTRREIPATMWRFLVMDDPSVVRYLVRDADALLSEREVPTVAQWLESGRWFHHMRDYFTHTELLLAGMWGGCNGVFPALYPLMRDFAASHQRSARFTDQHFLREVLWATVRESILNHDELFGFHGAQPFPAHPPIRWRTSEFHVGSNVSFRRIGGQGMFPDGEVQTIVLDEDGEPSREYQARIQNEHWSMDFPFYLIDALGAGTLRVSLASDAGK